jgi:predicted  nucleic acid-binding Zn-ribbon protein
MKSTVKHIVKKVTLELIYDVVDERIRELKEEIKSTNSRLDQMRQEHKEDFKSVNARIEQIHTRLDQIMHMLAELRK